MALIAEGARHVETSPSLQLPVLRWIGLLVLLAAELGGLTTRFDGESLAGNTHWWAAAVGKSHVLLNAGFACVAAFLVIVAPRLKTVLRTMGHHARSYRWQPSLAWHGVAFGAFALCTAVLFEGHATTARALAIWSASWTVLGSATLGCWLLAVAPGAFWRQLARQESAAWLVASAVGAGAWASGKITQEFWQPLAAATLWLVSHLLGMLYTDVTHRGLVIGTSAFEVDISPECSGFEGLGLITVFLTLYFWLFRRRLRFPHVLVLFPVGAVAIWLANALRITALIAIGTSVSPAVASGGFHSQAGWIAFLVVGLGLVALTDGVQFFAAADDVSTTAPTAPVASALLLPLLAMLAAMMLTAAFSSGFDWLYPLRPLTAGVVLWYFRKVYRQFTWTWSWGAAAVGIAVWVVWILLEPAAASGNTALGDGLANLSGAVAAVWLGFRVVGSVIAVPVAEELAFRGYVMRKLVAADFERVPLGRFTWASFLLSSVLFGVLHGRWLAGTLAGMAYALVLTRRGQLADAVVAHMTTNALIAAYVLSLRAWSLWS